MAFVVVHLVFEQDSCVERLVLTNYAIGLLGNNSNVIKESLEPCFVLIVVSHTKAKMDCKSLSL